MSKTNPAGAVSITVQPQTLTNVTVSNGTSTYPIEECTLSVVNGQTIYNFYAGDSSCYPFGAKTTSLTFNADGCQPYTIQDIQAESEWTVTMEPTSGYKKMYAWDNGNWYTESATPSVGDDVYIYKPLSDEYAVNGVVEAVSTNTIDIQSFT